MNELAVQGANDTNQDIDRDAINQELDALTTELDRISQTTQFNKQNLLDGTFVEKNLQVGANTNQKITLSINNMNAAAIGLSTTTISAKSGYFTGSGTCKAAASGTIRTCVGNQVACATTMKMINAASINASYAGKVIKGQTSGAVKACIVALASQDAKITTTDSKASQTFKGARVDNYDIANATISKVQYAINEVSSQRSYLGALQNRLEHTIANLDNVSENTQSAESRIRDTDMASEMVEYSKNNILAQAGQAMLAQANQSTQGVLSLLQ
jgi:flagellin